MSKVYVVTSGCFDEYGIETIRSSREDAERIAKVYPYGTVEEFELDEPQPEYPEDSQIYTVHLTMDGEVDFVTQSDPILGPGRCFYRPCWPKVIFDLWAIDEDNAIELAKQRFKKFVEEGGLKESKPDNSPHLKVKPEGSDGDYEEVKADIFVEPK